MGPAAGLVWNWRQKMRRSIAFPSISTGIYSFPVGQAAGIAVGMTKEFAEDHSVRLDVIKWKQSML